jgi:nucleoside-diphosphate-sugar epimerase
MAKCLVTGHKGYIGSKLFKRLKELGHDVIGIDLLEQGAPKDVIKVLEESADGKFHPHYYNFQPEYIFHMACWPRVVYSVQNPVETAKNNIMAGAIVLNFARKVGSVKKVIYSSSSSVVGNGNGPASPYALQKYATELETTIYSSLYDLDTVSLRYFNVYSYDQKADGPYATAVASWMKSIKENTVPYITGDGEQKRDMISVDDVVRANIFCMNYSEKFKGAVYDVGTGESISLNEISAIIKQYFPEIKFNYVEPRKGDVMFSRADISGLSDIGWKASIKIEDGISDCFRRLK